MKARGRAAFSMTVDDTSGIVKMRAELLQGAQLNRNDRLVFSRSASITIAQGSFKGSLKAILDKRLEGRYISSLGRLSAKSAEPGTIVAIASGSLELSFQAAENDRQRWTKARSGNLYTVASFWIGLGPNFDMGLGVPPGLAALLSASLIFSQSPQ